MKSTKPENDQLHVAFGNGDKKRLIDHIRAQYRSGLEGNFPPLYQTHPSQGSTSRSAFSQAHLVTPKTEGSAPEVVTIFSMKDWPKLQGDEILFRTTTDKVQFILPDGW
jgi:hypothetical protein